MNEELVRKFNCKIDNTDFLMISTQTLENRVCVSIETYFNSADPIFIDVNQLNDLIQFLQQCKTKIESKN